jgi:hypothetical protein
VTKDPDDNKFLECADAARAVQPKQAFFKLRIAAPVRSGIPVMYSG